MDSKVSNKQWVEHWRKIGPILQEFRDEESRNSTPFHSIESLNDAFEFILGQKTENTYSGLVDYQRAISKLPR